MLNAVQPDVNLQTMLHKQLIKHLGEGWALGRATKPFRWAAGNYYARAIHTFSKLTGTLPPGPQDLASPIGDMVTGMSRDHVTATDFRNFILLGDQTVRLSA